MAELGNAGEVRPAAVEALRALGLVGQSVELVARVFAQAIEEALGERFDPAAGLLLRPGEVKAQTQLQIGAMLDRAHSDLGEAFERVMREMPARVRAFTDLVEPHGPTQVCVFSTAKGTRLRVVKAYDVTADDFLWRIDLVVVPEP